MIEQVDDKPYRRGLTVGLGAALASGLVLAICDVAAHQTQLAAGPLLALWLAAGLLLGIPLGLILGAGDATFGHRFVVRALARLAAQRSRDLAITGAVLAALVVAGPAIVVIGKLAVALVGDVERKAVGGMLLGVVVVVTLPAWAAAALPVSRVTRHLAKLLPHTAKLPAMACLLGLGLAGAFALTAFYVLTRLDWRALQLGSLLALAALPALTLIMAGLWAAAVAEWPRLLAGVVAGLAALALGLPVVTLPSKPSAAVSRAVLDRSWIGARAIAALRGRIDRDHDGESAFFGGPDCDDHNPAVRSGTPEIPGNGIDDNCVGGDGKAPPATAAATPSNLAAPAPAPASALARNVLLIFIDTLRFDRLGIAGYRRDGQSLTPHIDALAAQSVVFRQAFAQAPNTPRSVPSFMTSRYPSQVMFEKAFADYPSVLDANDLMFEALAGLGLQTAAVTSHFYFCDPQLAPRECADFRHPKRSNIRQGVADWDNEGALDIAPSNKDVAAPRIVPRAIKKLEALAQGKQRFAMMVHLFEPHSSYMEHPGHPITEHGTAGLAQKYDYEIAFADEWIGKLLETLERSGLAGATMVVLIADHGEAFGAHTMAGEKMFFHGQTLYNELLHVPMMVRAPGVKPRMAEDVVQLIDLAPTMVTALGGGPPPSWQGRSLLPALRGEPLAPAPAFAELLPAPAWDHDARAMISGDGKYKVYYRKSDSRWEIYDLQKDPEELHDLSERAGFAAVADPLKQELTTWMERTGG
jgi:arylsulfatase A-like enzyme